MAVDRSSFSGISQPRSGEEIRKAFLTFFAERGHEVVPSASLIPDDPTVLLTIAGMLPFKPVFLGHRRPPAPRATSSQKCIRTNDIENVGRTARHHTFFEMLGNFSFGDYFKREAIQWAWELSTDVFGLDPRSLVVSVYREDDEAEEIWRDVVGVNPQRIIRMDERDNFWASGPTGPCGPCSELYFDFKAELGDVGIDLEDDTRFIEFYNLVFMQYNRDSEGNLTPLANCNIDTGMGLERMAQILQGVPNNYETDLIYPLIEKAASLAKIDYEELDEKAKTSLKVIADHGRAVTQLICDGVTTSNLGRGYVLRRLIRRVVRHGRLIGLTNPFLVDMADTAIDLMKPSFPQLLERRQVILRELEREESRFMDTLERGEKLLADVLAGKPKKITGEQAFELYDTYGFPWELTEEIAQEHGINVDIKEFEKAMDVQRKRAKDASLSIDVTLQDTIDRLGNELRPTSFLGYTKLEHTSSVQALVVHGETAMRVESGDEVQIILDSTSFYGEGGGQVGDRGVLISKDSDAKEVLVEIDRVSRSRDVFVHYGRIRTGSVEVGDSLHGLVHQTSRRRAQAHHTATHLLQSALKLVVDSGIHQAGSLVSFERMRFDFHSPCAVSSLDLKKVEELINTWIVQSHRLEVHEMPIEDAKNAGAVAMFGEKYGADVRVVDIPGVSMELCGGTHVANTAELGAFKVVSETGIASGIRRIEAVAGPAVLDYLNERDVVVKELGRRFKAQPNEIVQRVLTLQDELKSLEKTLLLTRSELAIAKALGLVTQTVAIGESQYLVERLDGLNGDSLQSAAKSLLDQLGASSVVILAGAPELQNQSKVILVAAFGSHIISRGLKAGSFIGDIAKICGGGGGGRPNIAQAGGRDAKALDGALDEARNKLRLLLA